jgi:uncharacterized protein YdaU (DUF1376 family)
MKETFYFSHDYHARDDEKITKMIQKCGIEGYGIFWMLVEKLYEEGGLLDKDYGSLAFALRTDSERIAKVVESGLFEFRNEKFYSKSVNARLIKRKGKSEMARQSANLRWSKPKKDNANAMRTQCERNAIKESKVKESKVKISIAETSSALEIIPNLLEDKQQHIKIIGLFALKNSITFTSLEQQRSFIRRYLRPASDLKSYPIEKISAVMDWLNTNADYKWTLETVGKTIDFDLKTLTNKTQSDDDWFKKLK